MAANYTLNSQSYEGRHLQLTCTQTRNFTTNKSTINWTLTSTGGSVNYYTTGATTVSINGVTVYSKGITYWNSYTFPAAKGSVSGSLEVEHDALGTKTIPVSITTAIYYAAGETKSGNWNLDAIPKKATLTSVMDFTDESNPAITYSNLAKNTVTSLQACIADDKGQTIYAAYRDISKTATTYIFNLTDAEREVLRAAVIKGTTLNVRFYVKTVINNSTYYDFKPAIMTLINATPLLNPVAIPSDMNNTVKLTGSQDIWIRYISHIEARINATARKGATIVSQSIKCGGTTINASMGMINAVESGEVVFTATDSRGNTTTQKLTKELVAYDKLTCNLGVMPTTTDGAVKVDVYGNFFNGTFGSKGTVTNSIICRVRYKESGGEYPEWGAMQQLTLSYVNNTYHAETTFYGLDYRKQYVFEAYALDSAPSYMYSQEVVTQGMPVFDWGERDFNFNVPVSFEGVTMRDFVVEEQIDGSTWQYRKWNNGKAELQYRFRIGAAITQQKGSLYRTNAMSLSLPFTMPDCYATVDCLDGNCWASCSTYGLPASSINYIIWCPWEYQGEVIVSVNITGRWK